nr:ABC transporter C family member 8-like [Tanacetum cinerariifolium]
MKDGKVTQSGTYEELLMVGTAFEQPVTAHKDAAGSYWLAFGIPIPKIKTIMLISVYTLLLTTSVFCVFRRSCFATLLGLKASKSFFNKFTDSIFNAPMVFFDSTPAMSDQSVIDFDIPFSIAYVIGAGIEILAKIAIMASVTWQVLIVAIIAVAASQYAQPTAMADEACRTSCDMTLMVERVTLTKSGRKYSYSRKDLGNHMDANKSPCFRHMSLGDLGWLVFSFGDEVLTVFWSAKLVLVVADEGVFALVMNWLTAMHFYSS